MWGTYLTFCTYSTFLPLCNVCIGLSCVSMLDCFHLTLSISNLSFWMITGERHQYCVREDTRPAYRSSCSSQFVAWKVPFPNAYCDKQRPLKRARGRPAANCTVYTLSLNHQPGNKLIHHLQPSLPSLCRLTADAILQTLFFFFFKPSPEFDYQSGRCWFPYQWSWFTNSLRTRWPRAPLDANVALCGTWGRGWDVQVELHVSRLRFL